MHLKNILPNQVELCKDDGTVVFISYATPVAAFVEGSWIRSAEKYSATTSKHVNQWLGRCGCDAETVPQSQIDSLMPAVSPLKGYVWK